MRQLFAREIIEKAMAPPEEIEEAKKNGRPFSFYDRTDGAIISGYYWKGVNYIVSISEDRTEAIMSATMKPDAKTLPARIYAHVMCPDCGYVMINHEDYITCVTDGCDYRGEKWNHPVVTLTRIDANKGAQDAKDI